MARTSEDILLRRTKLGIDFPKEAKDKLEIILDGGVNYQDDLTKIQVKSPGTELKTDLDIRSLLVILLIDMEMKH